MDFDWLFPVKTVKYWTLFCYFSISENGITIIIYTFATDFW